MNLIESCPLFLLISVSSCRDQHMLCPRRRKGSNSHRANLFRSRPDDRPVSLTRMDTLNVVRSSLKSAYYFRSLLFSRHIRSPRLFYKRLCSLTRATFDKSSEANRVILFSVITDAPLVHQSIESRLLMIYSVVVSSRCRQRNRRSLHPKAAI